MAREPDWLDPAGLQICWLNDKTPPGLFSASGGLTVWVVDTVDGPHGVRLSEGDGQFLIWKLEPGFNHSGVHLGPVELQLDVRTIEMPDNMPEAGDLDLQGDTVTLIGASSRGYIRAPTLVVGRLSPAGEHPLSFRCAHWSLVRVSGEDRKIVFEHPSGADPE